MESSYKEGDDVIYAGEGEDIVDGGSGVNTLYLSAEGPGNLQYQDGDSDTVTFNMNTFSGTGSENTIHNFEVGTDILKFTEVNGGTATDLDAMINNITENNGNVEITMNDGAVAILDGVSAAQAGFTGTVSSITDLTNIQVQVTQDII